MTNIEKNASRIAELILPRCEILKSGVMKYNGIWFGGREPMNDAYKYYNKLMPIVFECNYEQDDLDIEIVIYGSGLDVRLDDEDILIAIFDTQEGFIEAIQLACIKYLELKNVQ